MSENAKQFNFEGQAIELRDFQGLVVDAQQHAETSVSGSVYDGRGSVSTTVTRYTRFVIRTPAGKEMPFSMAGHNLHVRCGNRVSVIRIESPRFYNDFAIINHDSEEWQYRASSSEDIGYVIALVKRPPGCFLWILAFSLMASFPIWGELGGDAYGVTTAVLALMSGAFIMVWLMTVSFWRGWRASRVWKQVRPRVEQHVSILLQNTDDLQWQ